VEAGRQRTSTKIYQMNADKLIAAIRVWDSTIPKSDEDLRILREGFKFLSEFHHHDCRIMAGHYSRELESVNKMIAARKEKK